MKKNLLRIMLMQNNAQEKFLDVNLGRDLSYVLVLMLKQMP
jgi:hypothetical protein